MTTLELPPQSRPLSRPLPMRKRRWGLALLALAFLALSLLAVATLLVERTGEESIGSLIAGDAAGPEESSPAAAAMTLPRFGVNLSGAEAQGADAVRPTLADLHYYVEELRFDMIRYPFKMDRMTPDRIAEMRTLTNYARSRDVPFILDNHNYGWPPVEAQIAFWTRFARQFPDDGSVLLDLNNEPKGVEWMQWASDAKQIVAGLRRSGIRHPILLEWPGWSAVTRFDKHEARDKPCASAGCALDRTPGPLDPLGRTYMNGHRYFDPNGSGLAATCLQRNGTPRERSGFVAFAAQLRQRGLQGYITEAAFGNYRGIPESCKVVGDEAVRAIRANADVLRGITWWGGGRLWPDRYPFKIECPKAQRTTCPPSVYQQAISPRLAARAN